MFKRTGFKMVMASLMLVFLVLIGSNANLYAGSPEGSTVPLKGGKIVGVLSGICTESGGVFSLQVTVVGSYYKPSGTIPVALDPVQITNLSISNFDEFLALSKQDLENETLENAGPPGAFSENGGEKLIITRVKDVFVAKSKLNHYILGAIVTIRAYAN